jgi:hypothetical protein
MTDEELETLIAEALQRDAAELMREIVLPSRHLVVWKARLYARRVEARRATRPIERVFFAAPVLTLVSAVSFGIASGAFRRITAMPVAAPAAFLASFLAAAILAAAPFCLWKIGGLE